MNRSSFAPLIFLICSIVSTLQLCVHDHFIKNTSLHYYDDFSQKSSRRLLQTAPIVGRRSMRIFMDYTWLKGSQTQNNQVKRIMNITANYFYNIITLERLDILKYPLDAPPQCNVIPVPDQYIVNGTIGDVGVLVSSEVNPVGFIAKSSSCVLQKSNNRPLWGVMIWNINFLELDQVGFQKILFVGIHQILHILAYSSNLYDKFPAGNPFRNQSGLLYLTSPAIVREMNAYFGCSNSKGLILQDQDGTLYPSHSQFKVFGNQVMIAVGRKGAYFSRVTAALLESTGWYNVSYNLTEPSVWGKNKGCGFLNPDDCSYDQFCSGSNFSCDAQSTAIGRCQIQSLSGSCKVINYFTNTICIDQNYEIRNLNANMQAMERGGFNSRCLPSNFRKSGVNATVLNYRCYITLCSVSGSFLYIMVGQTIIVCSKTRPGRIINAPSGMDGTLQCPSNFDNYCGTKKTCAFHCNRNGVCINGKCLCTGELNLTSTCLDIGFTVSQMDNKGGLIKSLFIDGQQILEISNSKIRGLRSQKDAQAIQRIIKVTSQSRSLIFKRQRSINTKAPEGFFFDSLFGEIVSCQKIFKCAQCTEYGCSFCGIGEKKVGSTCAKVRKI